MSGKPPDAKETKAQVSPSPEVSALSAIANLTGEAVHLHDILSASLDRVLEVVSVEVAYVSLVDEEAGTLVVAAHLGVDEGFASRVSESTLDEGLPERAVQSGQPSAIEDVSEQPELVPDAVIEERLLGYACAPLKSSGKVVGVLSVASYQPHQFSTPDLEFLAAAAGQMAVAVQNAQLREEITKSRVRVRERVKELIVLYDVSREASLASDIDAFLSFVARRLPASMQYQEAVAVIYCAPGQDSYLAWSDNTNKETAERLRVVPGEGGVGRQLTDSSASVECVETGLEPVWVELDVKSVLALPLSLNGQLVGSVVVYYLGESRRFLEEEKRLLRGIAQQIAQFITRDAIERQNRQHAQEISTLFDVSKALASVVELEELLPTIADTLVETLAPAEAGALLLFDQGTSMLTVASAFGYSRAPLRRISLRVGESISGKVFESGTPGVWATPEQAADGMANMTPHNRAYFRQGSGGLDYPESSIGVPLMYRDEKIGVLTLETLQNKAGLSVSDLPFLQALAELVAINVSQIRLLQQTQQAKAIEEADRLKSELIAALAHDMRTPLASIKGYTSALLLDDVHWDENTRAEYLKIIDEESSDLQTMIQDLLESSIIDAGLMQIEKEPTLLPRVVQGLIKEMTRRTAKHRFVISFPADFPIVKADPRRIEQVVRNLLDNAVKYSPDGGLVVVRGQVADDELIISVADEGVGIAPEHLNRLFEKFFRLKSPLHDKLRGSGLGLPVSRTIVESHGGRIWAESQLGKGTTIYFSLPQETTGAPTGQE